MEVVSVTRAPARSGTRALPITRDDNVAPVAELETALDPPSTGLNAAGSWLHPGFGVIGGTGNGSSGRGPPSSSPTCNSRAEIDCGWTPATHCSVYVTAKVSGTAGSA